MTIDRREFLRRIAAGSAVVTLPAWLQGCGVQPAQLLGSKTPEDPYLAWFGIDEPQVRALMSTLTTGGADIADIYFQQKRASRDTVPWGPQRLKDLSVRCREVRWWRSRGGLRGTGG